MCPKSQVCKELVIGEDKRTEARKQDEIASLSSSDFEPMCPVNVFRGKFCFFQSQYFNIDNKKSHKFCSNGEVSNRTSRGPVPHQLCL